ncbi:peroxiredoxin-like family protein [Nocardiopsis trehalosi]|jgi:peroxiredoxin|uniref:peroxiredoxin-like family protein n=1 Tax=Nocardiopsis trehalosi TaxID=109329 RepID=UPI00082C44BE|nr:peroxiredoxin-like family protein [Nocardiopsis trehalosi]
MPVRATPRRFAVGDTVPARTLTDLRGDPVAVPDPDRLLHLQFRRFAGCPICHLHLRSVARRHDEIAAAGVREVAVFHSSAADLLRHEPDLPFPLVADPDRALYREFGVEAAPRALLDPRAWPGIARALRHGTRAAARGAAAPPLTPEGGRLGLPADLLVAPDGTVAALRYGAHADDQWSVDEILAAARAARP